MARLHENQLALAESLIERRFGSASLRRCVSTAYYALLQRLSELCASRLSGGLASSDEYRRLYRALDHKLVKAELNRSYGADLGARFATLQAIREWADYAHTSHPDLDLAEAGKRFSSDEARVYVERAREAIRFIDALSATEQRKLAIFLVVRERSESGAARIKT